MSFITDLLSGGASKLVDSVGAVLDNVITTKEEKQTLDNEIVKAEMQFQVDMAKLSVEEMSMLLGDISNARQREVNIHSIEKASWLNKNLMPIVTLGTIWLAMSLFFILIFKPRLVGNENKEVVFYILGVVSAILTQVYSYYFGSSAGSARKSVTIANFKKEQ